MTGVLKTTHRRPEEVGFYPKAVHSFFFNITEINTVSHTVKCIFLVALTYL